jgi:hypothetical protein
MEQQTVLTMLKNNSLNYGEFRLDYFDGLRMFAMLEQLKELQNRVRIN